MMGKIGNSEESNIPALESKVGFDEIAIFKPRKEKVVGGLYLNQCPQSMSTLCAQHLLR